MVLLMTFLQLPVRRLSHPSAQRTLELVKKDVEALSLVFPDVSFSLENTNRTARTKQDQGRVLTVPKV